MDVFGYGRHNQIFLANIVRFALRETLRKIISVHRRLSVVQPMFLDSQPEEEINQEQDSSMWLSIGDLMSGLLMFFALLFIAVKVQLQHKAQKVEELQSKIEEYDQVMNQLPQRIVNALEGKIGGTGDLIVDPETGDVKLDNRVLFGVNSAKLTTKGKKFLQEFIPVYSAAIFSSQLIEEQVAWVVIEGHTSSEGLAQSNLDLSLDRASSVFNYIFSEELQFPDQERFKEKILVGGRGSLDAEQRFVDEKDRKVVFRFQFRRENFQELLREWKKLQPQIKAD